MKKINGITFKKWVEIVAITMKNADCPYYTDEGFVKHIARFCWESVIDNDADGLLVSLDGCFYEMDKEYDLYLNRQH